MASNLILIDTGAWFAYIDRRDEAHEVIANIVKSHNEMLLTTNYIIDELITLLRVRRVPILKFQQFIDDLIVGNICKIERDQDRG